MNRSDDSSRLDRPATPKRAPAPDATAQRSRRAFLGGAAALIALPALESLAPRRAAWADPPRPPRRLLAYYVPCGMYMPAWTPAAAGRAWAATPILAPVMDFARDVLVLTGLQNIPGRPPDNFGGHSAGTGAFLSATRVAATQGAVRGGISLDQVVARAVGGATRFASLELGAEDAVDIANFCEDSLYNCAYGQSIAWADATTQLPKIVNPRTVFNRLFAGRDAAATSAEQARRRADDRSVLDYALADAARVRARVGRSDQHKLDEYLTGLRDLERRIARASPGASATCGGGGGGVVPADRPADYTERVRLMTDLMVLAFQCDLTRVITFMLGGAGSNRNYGFMGVNDGHHYLSHHAGDPEKIRRLQRIDAWEVARFADLLRGLKAAREADGSSLLDHTAVYFSSELGDGDRHENVNLPVLLAGRAGGALDPGRHVRYASPRPIADLYVALLRAMGVAGATRFGDDSTGPLDQLGAASG